MAQYIPDVLLWLFVINHGIAFGAGLYEQRIIVPQWFSRSSEGIRVNSAAMCSTDAGRGFWVPWHRSGWRSITCAQLLL